MGSFKTIFAYLLFALLAVLVFLYLLFPDEAVKTVMDNRLAAIDPSLTLTAETIRPALPLAVNMIGVDLKRNGFKMIHADQAWLAPALSTLFKAQKRFAWKATLSGGVVEGRLFTEGNGPSGKLRMEADLSSIRLEQIEALKSLSQFTLSGPLSGRLTHAGARAPGGQANGLLTAPGLRITLKRPVFGIAELSMDQTEADFSINGQTLRLKALTFDGPLMEGSINGRIEIENPFGRSRLSLNGNVKPRPELFAQLQDTLPQGIINPRTLENRGLNFRVFGTFDNPDVSMR
jgi:type II secretion system protein N